VLLFLEIDVNLVIMCCESCRCESCELCVVNLVDVNLVNF
jgi:hypothetical protein